MQQLLATSDTTTLNYWLNWRVLLCAIWVFTPVAVAFFLIRKYECLGSCKGKTQQEVAHSLCGNQPWRSCLIHVHPLWLLAYRLISFSLLLAILIAKVSRNGFVMFYYYTQWTFTSVTIYFGFGSLLSIYGCYLYHKRGGAGFYEPHVGRDNEQGYYIPLPHGDRANILEKRKSSEPPEETQSSQAASICSYLFQVIFQMTAGAVMLTDSIYWFIIFPFLTLRDYSMDFLTVSMHSLNAVLLLGDTALNCLPFPWFRVSYFILWTGFFVIFQWIVHACVSIWWPYPFLDLSSIYAPIWYLLVAMMHIPSYGLFMLFVKIKHNLLTKWFPQSYSC
ncbi:UDP-N-acetylglucosamine-N-acetylmuramyl-pyrophosphoryl-undecaprenol [Salix suchowensis]|nr:UDP-N-acetylglucosamine-N-acetylmuramyl-pyrophosphoryl-undecaprenol [Salix suchowensis]